MLTLNDGRKEMYQWDIGRIATIDFECDVVHFSNLKYGASLSVEVKNGEVAIPNKLLTSGEPIYCWAFVSDVNGNYTKREQTLNVNKRAKPSDYVYTETETLTWKSLDERITELEKGGTVSTMTGATADTDGAAGLVPAPKAGQHGKFLRGDGTWAEADKTLSKDGYAADAKVVGEKISELSVKISDGVSWNELKDKPFYLNKTLFIALTKDDFTVSNQGGNVKYLYRSTPKLDWITSLESVALEIEIVDINGKRYTATQDSIDIYFEKETTDDGYEYWNVYSYYSMFEIVSGVDLDFYYNDGEYYYKDEWGILVGDGRELSEINVKIYSVDVKKIPEICLDAAIGKTKITVGGLLEESVDEINPRVIVPDLIIPIDPSSVNDSEIYYDTLRNRLRMAGNLFPYDGHVTYKASSDLPVSAGESISFDISEGHYLWDRVSDINWSGLLWFEIQSYYYSGNNIEFLAFSPYVGQKCAIAASDRGRIYFVMYHYAPDRKSLNITIKCVME